jgi:Mn2+/Fe2+ NRAMP family transporter
VCPKRFPARWAQDTSAKARGPKWLSRLTVFGSGIVVMLADTDAGSVITAAQSGAEWGYQLLVWQVILMPILYIAQELTVGLGLITQRGHGELIREQFGKGWAWLSVGALLVACAGAIITEFSAAAGVGNIYGVPPRCRWALASKVLPNGTD